MMGGKPPWITFPGSPVLSLQVLSPLANELFHKAIMESGVAIIPYLQARDKERDEDVGILLTLLWLPVLGTPVDRPRAGLADHGQNV